MSYLFEKYDYSLFESRFRDYNRLESFPGQSLRMLFDYLSEMAKGSGQPIEIDVIGLCCDFYHMTEAEAMKENNLNESDEIFELENYLSNDGDDYLFFAI